MKIHACEFYDPYRTSFAQTKTVFRWRIDARRSDAPCLKT